jgi:rare lipoprotein A
VKVINLTNNKSVVVRINDRGPYVKGRIIDLTKNAAKEIGMVGGGVAKVKIRYKKK